MLVCLLQTISCCAYSQCSCGTYRQKGRQQNNGHCLKNYRIIIIFFCHSELNCVSMGDHLDARCILPSCAVRMCVSKAPDTDVDQNTRRAGLVLRETLYQSEAQWRKSLNIRAYQNDLQVFLTVLVVEGGSIGPLFVLLPLCCSALRLCCLSASSHTKTEPHSLILPPTASSVCVCLHQKERS